MESTRLRPRIAPRSPRDLARALTAGTVLMVPIVGIPVSVLVVTGDSMQALTTWVVLLPPIAILIALTMVHEIRAGADGLRFRRRAGSPQHLAWDEVTRVRASGPGEVMLRGWLWPPFPPREATKSLTSEGHYRIDYEGGFVFFPPEDPAAFLAAVERWAPDALDRDT